VPFRCFDYLCVFSPPPPLTFSASWTLRLNPPLIPSFSPPSPVFFRSEPSRATGPSLLSSLNSALRYSACRHDIVPWQTRSPPCFSLPPEADRNAFSPPFLLVERTQSAVNAVFLFYRRIATSSSFIRDRQAEDFSHRLRS